MVEADSGFFPLPVALLDLPVFLVGLRGLGGEGFELHPLGRLPHLGMGYRFHVLLIL